MAQQDIVGGLFGMTPESYQQGMNRRDTAANLTAAQLTPGQLAGYYAMQAGTGLGRATQGLLGVEDPQMQLVSRTNQLVQQIGVDTPEKLRTLAGELQKIPGGAQLAAQAVERANKMLESAATIQAKTREQYSGFGKLIRERDSIAAMNPNDPRIKDYDKAIAAEQEGKGTKIVMPPGQKNVLAVESKKAEDLQKQIGSGYTVLERLTEQEQAIERGMIGGSFADTRTGLATFASSIGLADPNLVNALANSKSFKANQNALAAAIAKQLGVNPTDKDFQASLEQFAKNTDDPKASLIFIKQMKDKFGQRQKINEDMFNSYIENDGTFRNYKGPKMVESFTGTDELSKLLAEKATRTKKNTKGE